MDLPNVDAIYFTESEQELSDLIFIHRWCMVFNLSSSTIGDRLRKLRPTLTRVEAGSANPYINDKNIQGGAALLAKNAAQVKDCISFLESREDSQITVLIPLTVFRDKIQGLFDWFNECLQASYSWKKPNAYFIRGFNTLTNRPLYRERMYTLEYSSDSEGSIRKSVGCKQTDVPGIWSLGDRIQKESALESENSACPSGDWLIDGDAVDIYNNDLSNGIRKINPCTVCPNGLKRTVGNCYFMTSQCKALVLPTSEDKTSWKTLKSK